MQLGDDIDSKQEVDKNMLKLVELTVEHFKREEYAMKVHNYPGLLNHQQVHKRLVEQIKNKQAQVLQGKLATKELMEFFGRWWDKYVQGMDRAFCLYCAGK